ncbi:HAD family hydrolase [Aeromonas veronii]|uniref:HAD family hydrolase n=1 Tax=Aeromonas veronii TaxID=654 RepID=UPI00214DAD7F|nr:HAD family hydrolase [Aeromonas veronii]MCR3969093.1 HAD family hydrolase [Aeromonas veronii]MCR3981558.1 HAD family hydrolase [Aeromonas veronii]
MPQLSNYDVYIFDCDGVVLDSNSLKLEAMKNALQAHFSNHKLIEACVGYFRDNFGMSRFHHVDHFLENLIPVKADKKKSLSQKILNDYSMHCRKLYLTAELTSGFRDFLQKCSGKKYIASGSEQNELRDVFKLRGLDVLFDNIYGSPTSKKSLVASILDINQKPSAVLFGDAYADMYAAIDNNIDFVAYLPFSLVKENLKDDALNRGFDVIYSWEEYV